MTAEDKFSGEKEWLLFCDESVQKGNHYSNFFGGVLVRATQVDRIERMLADAIAKTGIGSEVKWNKVTEQWLAGYLQLVNLFFDEVFQGNLRVRVMFRQNSWVGPDLTPEQKENSYFLLYYQFIKHAFGFGSLVNPSPIHLRLYFDQFPHKQPLVAAFRENLVGMMGRIGPRSGLFVRPDAIAEVRSHDHAILQVLDVVLGSMAFRLNDGHKFRIEGQRAIPMRTKARIEVYKQILKRIEQGLGRRFNIGISTGRGDDESERWRLPYAHWAFVPHGAVHRSGVGKKAEKEPHSDLHQGPT